MMYLLQYSCEVDLFYVEMQVDELQQGVYLGLEQCVDQGWKQEGQGWWVIVGQGVELELEQLCQVVDYYQYQVLLLGWEYVQVLVQGQYEEGDQVEDQCVLFEQVVVEYVLGQVEQLGGDYFDVFGQQ